MKSFYQLLIVALVVSVTNNFVWFALTYWAYLETKSVVSTSIVGGVFLIAAALTSFWFGSIVDYNKKKKAMKWSSLVTLAFFISGWVIFRTSPEGAFSAVSSARLWIFVLMLLSGTVVGNIYNIAIPTLVTLLVPEDRRDKANGLFGTVMGLSFAITSVASGMILGFWGMSAVLSIAVGFTILALVMVSMLSIPEKTIVPVRDETGKEDKKIDIKGTIKVVASIPGLFALIFFTTFNNFLGGVFMALMDAYGLTLVSVQVWGLLWGFLSLGFIFGGLYIAKKGLGKNPLRTLFLVNMIIWATCIVFVLQPSIILLAAGSLVWLCLIPFIEATEQTIIQKVVPVSRQGRVFGFAHSIEQAASPLTAFFIGPIAQFAFIPFMTTGAGVDLIGSWFGVGVGRGIALVFIISGIIGVIVTTLAMRSRSYKLLSEMYLNNE